MPNVARLGDQLSHGGNITGASPNVYSNGLPIARVGDTVDCEIHGQNYIVSSPSDEVINGIQIAVEGAICHCGAIISTGSQNVYAN